MDLELRLSLSPLSAKDGAPSRQLPPERPPASWRGPCASTARQGPPTATAPSEEGSSSCRLSSSSPHAHARNAGEHGGMPPDHRDGVPLPQPGEGGTGLGRGCRPGEEDRDRSSVSELEESVGNSPQLKHTRRLPHQSNSCTHELGLIRSPSHGPRRADGALVGLTSYGPRHADGAPVGSAGLGPRHADGAPVGSAGLGPRHADGAPVGCTHHSAAGHLALDHSRTSLDQGFATRGGSTLDHIPTAVQHGQAFATGLRDPVTTLDLMRQPQEKQTQEQQTQEQQRLLATAATNNSLLLLNAGAQHLFSGATRPGAEQPTGEWHEPLPADWHGPAAGPKNVSWAPAHVLSGTSPTGAAMSGALRTAGIAPALGEGVMPAADTGGLSAVGSGAPRGVGRGALSGEGTGALSAVGPRGLLEPMGGGAAAGESGSGLCRPNLVQPPYIECAGGMYCIPPEQGAPSMIGQHHTLQHMDHHPSMAGSPKQDFNHQFNPQSNHDSNHQFDLQLAPHDTQGAQDLRSSPLALHEDRRMVGSRPRVELAGPRPDMVQLRDHHPSIASSQKQDFNHQFNQHKAPHESQGGVQGDWRRGDSRPRVELACPRPDVVQLRDHQLSIPRSPKQDLNHQFDHQFNHQFSHQFNRQFSHQQTPREAHPSMPGSPKQDFNHELNRDFNPQFNLQLRPHETQGGEQGDRGRVESRQVEVLTGPRPINVKSSPVFSQAPRPDPVGSLAEELGPFHPEMPRKETPRAPTNWGGSPSPGQTLPGSFAPSSCTAGVGPTLSPRQLGPSLPIHGGSPLVIPSHPMQGAPLIDNSSQNATEDRSEDMLGRSARVLKKGSFHRFGSDGHVWNKYSHKRLRNSKTERSYYSCAEKNSLGCPARKLVDRPQREYALGDHSCDVVTLEGDHNHPPMRVTYDKTAPSTTPQGENNPPQEGMQEM